MPSVVFLFLPKRSTKQENVFAANEICGNKEGEQFETEREAAEGDLTCLTLYIFNFNHLIKFLYDSFTLSIINSSCMYQ